MTILSEIIFDIVDRIVTASTADEALDAFLQASRQVNLPYAIAHELPTQRGEEIHITAKAVPKGLLEGYFGNRLAGGDMVLEKAQGSSHSFHWCMDDWPVHDLTPDQRRWVEHCRTYHIASGISVLDFRPGSAMVLEAFGDRDGLTAHDRFALYFAGQELLYRLHDLAPESARHPEWLSHRERECLTWAAAGKTDWEIAQILSLSEKTVNVYINRAKSKFGVKSRAQAILRATKSGLIAH